MRIAKQKEELDLGQGFEGFEYVVRVWTNEITSSWQQSLEMCKGTTQACMKLNPIAVLAAFV